MRAASSILLLSAALAACSGNGGPPVREPMLEDEDAGVEAHPDANLAFADAAEMISDATTPAPDAETISDATAPAPDAETIPDAAETIPDASAMLGCPELGPAVALGPVAVAGLEELSGIAAGRVNPGVFWAHNDQSAELYALDRATLELRAHYVLTDANGDAYGEGDVEDLAIRTLPSGEAEIYLGDIGSGHPDNRLHIYRVLEPVLPAASVEGTLVAEVMDVSDARIQNAETLLVDPLDGTLVIVQKEDDPSACALGPFAAGTVVRPACDVMVSGLENPSAGDVSPDGNYVALRNEALAFIWIRPAGAPLTDAFATTACAFSTLATPANSTECNGEALAFSESGDALISAGENVDCATSDIHTYTFTRR